ncbi:MAG: hypothetical protein HRT73_07710 [Flavobacteriales bacterium]|nr:hypothetical protein [Flavobacteriales bacterium]
MKKLVIVIGFLFINNLFSQEYTWKSEIEKINSDNFYKIELTPQIISKLNTQFSDVRIKNNKGSDIPYFIEKESFSVTKRVFKEYQIKEKIKWKNGATVLVVENKNKDTINNIQLQIKNFDVRKHLELAGSDDYENWYTIKENYVFRTANGFNTTSEVKSLNFPYTDYKYYRIIIYDCFSLPINVLKIGYYDTYQELGKFKRLDTPVLTRFDSVETKQTYINVKFNEVPYFDKLTIKVDKPTYYYRNAKICFKREDKKGRIYYEVEKYININSNSELTFYFSDFKHKELYIVIDNEDNPPLENIRINAYQLNRYLVTHLEKNKNYELVFGNENMQRPNYDIEYFKNRVGKDTKTIITQNITAIKYKEKKKITTSTLWMWGSIGLVALLLGYMSYKMITEMERSK